MSSIDYRREFAKPFQELARISGEVIRSHFGKPAADLGLECKADDSPVTIADRKAEEGMREFIRTNFPDHGILAEEFGNENEGAEFTWVLDPIDGTVSFAAGCPLFGTLIGLLHDGAPVLGAIHQPLLAQFCMGDGNLTSLNGAPTRLRPCHSLSDATLLVTDVANVERRRDLANYESLRRKCRIQRGWGDCYGYLLLVTGGADIMLDPVMNPWDLLPLVPLVTGAGGSITAWDGASPVGADSCIASSPALHGQVVGTLQGGR